MKNDSSIEFLVLRKIPEATGTFYRLVDRFVKTEGGSQDLDVEDFVFEWSMAEDYEKYATLVPVHELNSSDDDDQIADYSIVSDLIRRVLAEKERLISLNDSDFLLEYDSECDAAALTDHKLVKANLRRWLSLPFWSPKEAAALLFGKEPSAFETKYAQKNIHIIRAYRHRVDLIERHSKAGILKPTSKPEEIQAWALKLGLSMPNALPAKKPEAVQDEIGSHHLTAEILRSVVLLLAINHYGFIARRGNEAASDQNGAGTPTLSGVAKSIERDLKARGLSGSERTIRKYLREAVEKLHDRGGDASLEKVNKGR